MLNLSDQKAIFDHLEKKGLLHHHALPAKERIIQYGLTVKNLVIGGWIIKKDFYAKLANSLNISFLNDLPLPINPYNSITNLFPGTLLFNHQVVPFEKENKLYFAVSDPFLISPVLDKLLLYTKYQSYEIVLAHPNEIIDTLQSVFLSSEKIKAEEEISILHPEVSVKKTENSARMSRILTILLLTFIGTMFLINWKLAAAFFFYLFNLCYILINPYKLIAFFKSLKAKETIEVKPHEIAMIDDTKLPVYSILTPLKNEVSMVNRLVTSLSAFDYPKNKLDLKYVVDTDDSETIKALRTEGIDYRGPDATSFDFWTSLIRVPKGTFATKPRACNYALKYARGVLTVIYDAEDRPDPDQLKKAYLGFLKTTLDTICIQAKLNFYNWKKNILTRFFSIEYGFWYEFFLTGLEAMRSPIPLGGTSNHFLTESLKKVGNWDPYNVTEDADLGLRIARFQYRTRIINSYTYEEANSHVWSWIKQRTRWEKGFIQTFVVHMRNPVKLIREIGFYKFLMAFLTFGTSFFLPFINPFLWLLFFMSLLPLIFGNLLPDLPDFARKIGYFNLIFGNLTYIFVHFLAVLKKKKYALLGQSLVIPIYWPLISIATYRAVWQFITNPYKWEKTTHGKK